MAEPGWHAGTLVIPGRRTQGLVERARLVTRKPGGPDDAAARRPHGQRPEPREREPGNLSESELASRVYRRALCAVSCVNPDQWYPVAEDVAKARDQAADAIAVCGACTVRADCLEFALRHASGVGAHGVWGGLLAAERLSLRQRWLAGTTVTQFLWEKSTVIG